MRVLVVGAGGVGSSAALIAARRDFFESWLVADYDLTRAEALVARIGDPRFSAARIDAADAHAVADLCRANRITHVLNAVDPRYVLSIFQGAFLAGAHYMDTAMSLSTRHPEKPFELPGVMLGDEQFAHHDQWVANGQLALVGMGVTGVDPGGGEARVANPGDERKRPRLVVVGDEPGLEEVPTGSDEGGRGSDASGADNEDSHAELLRIAPPGGREPAGISMSRLSSKVLIHLVRYLYARF
jgi:hypothetical protein